MRGRILHIESSFVRKAKARGGGIGMEEAVAAAESRVAAMGPQLLAQIDASLELAAEAGRRLPAGGATTVAEMRRAADNVVGLGGLIGLDGLAKAAASLCALIDWVGAAIDPDAVRVHLEAMQLLRHADAGMLAASTEPVLEGLARVSAHLGVPVTAPPGGDLDPEGAAAAIGQDVARGS